VPVGRQRDGGGGGDVADVDRGDPGRADRRRVQARAGQRRLERGVVLEEVPGPQDGERVSNAWRAVSTACFPMKWGTSGTARPGTPTGT
jgi:hypothetical protein